MITAGSTIALKVQDQDIEPLVKAEITLRHLFSKGEIPEDNYHQGLMVLAFQYSLAGDILSAKTRVAWCPEVYFKEVLPKQMKEQEGFRHIMYNLSKLFVALGEVDLTPKVVFDRKPALA